GISIFGEKYRIPKIPADSRGERNAVSDRFNSWAMCDIVSSLIGRSTRHTPAGLPLNGVSVKASTMKVLILLPTSGAKAFKPLDVPPRKIELSSRLNYPIDVIVGRRPPFH